MGFQRGKKDFSIGSRPPNETLTDPSENVLELCDEFAAAFEESTCFRTTERVDGAESQRDGDNYIKKRAVRLNYP